jgi:hypothetical protein
MRNRERRPTGKSPASASVARRSEAISGSSQPRMALRLCGLLAVRLGQEIESELQSEGLFFEPNVVVVKSLTGSNMRQAAENLAQSGLIKFLVPE